MNRKELFYLALELCANAIPIDGDGVDERIKHLKSLHPIAESVLGTTEEDHKKMLNEFIAKIESAEMVTQGAEYLDVSKTTPLFTESGAFNGSWIEKMAFLICLEITINSIPYYEKDVLSHDRYVTFRLSSFYSTHPFVFRHMSKKTRAEMVQCVKDYRKALAETKSMLEGELLLFSIKYD